MFTRIARVTAVFLFAHGCKPVAACDPEAAPACKGICPALENAGCWFEGVYNCSSSKHCEKLCALETEKGCGYRRKLVQVNANDVDDDLPA